MTDTDKQTSHTFHTLPLPDAGPELPQVQAPVDIAELVVAPAPTAGQLLRSARETAGLTLAALAMQLKVPERKLQALEEDRINELPDATFARALASSCCRMLKLDPGPVLALLPQPAGLPLKTSDESINVPFRKPSEMTTPAAIWETHRKTIVAVVGLLLAAIVLYNLPTDWLTSSSSSTSKTGSQVTETVVVAPVPGAPPAAETASMAQLPASSAWPPASAPSHMLAGGPPATAIVAHVMTPPAPTVASPTVKGSYVKDLIAFEARSDSWIEVTQTDGQLLLRRTLHAGEREVVSGHVPVVVAIGNADKTRVIVRGKSFDLNAVAKENVARFTVQ